MLEIEKKGLKLNKDNIKDVVKYVARIAARKGAEYLNILEMKNRLIITDFFIIIGAKNIKLTTAIEDEIKFRLKQLGFSPLHTSGLTEGNWILIDYNDFVVHIFSEEFRQFYNLERLWKDSKIVKWD
ncbi:MAG: ribosome silencing factor [Actinobacteria bacterium]|nr:ribosome silencing factor [Actinomycetota bacterium]MCL6087962.1 ribosome silencing factor [Actinomycetota bacterium]